MKLSISTMVFGLAACTAPHQPEAGMAPGGQRDCFNVSMVRGISSIDRDTVRIDVGPGADYEAETAGAQCDQIDWADQVALEGTPTSWVCVGNIASQAKVHFRDPTTRRRTSCYINNVRRTAKKS